MENKKLTYILEFDNFELEEFNPKSIIDTKMEELTELIKSVSSEKFIYEYSEEDEHILNIVFTYDEDEEPIKYIFDIKELELSKYQGDDIAFEEKLHDLEEGLSIIEEDVYMLHGVTEKKKIKHEKR